MKKLKFLLCALFAVLCCTALTACGDDDDDEPAGNSLVGTWLMQGGSDWYAIITLNADGTMAEIEYDEGDTYTATGTYSVSGNVITYSLIWAGDSYPETGTYIFTINGNTATLYDEDGKTQTWIRQ